MFKVKVKWGRELFQDVEVSTDDPPIVFKAQLFALTGVNPTRQKVMVKGTTIKDESWGNANLSNNCTVLLMGSKDEDVPVEPAVKPRFVEDMNESELATASNLPAGLANLGNTCYMNATVQCLKTVPELRDTLKQFKGGLGISGGIISAHSVTAALRDLYELMEKGLSIPPIMLLQVLQMVFPRFAEKNESGTFVQQDANECWSEIVRMLQQKLPAIYLDGITTRFNHFVDQYFGGLFDVELKCAESDEEPVTKTQEAFLQLSCFISQEVKYMLPGLKSKLMENITKKSTTLNRDATFVKTCKISRLPAYLTVQFVRFYYKEKESVNAKILKEVKFPLAFDAYELCSDELQKRLTPMREKFKEQEDKEALESTKVRNRNGVIEKIPEREMTKVPYSFEDDLGSNNSGFYTLQAVLTHRGRSSSSGHYVAWVKHSKDMWVKCDDDIVTPVSEEDVLKLCGGGDWHCAYVLLYGPRILEIPSKIDPDHTEIPSTVTSPTSE